MGDLRQGSEEKARARLERERRRPIDLASVDVPEGQATGWGLGLKDEALAKQGQVQRGETEARTD